MSYNAIFLPALFTPDTCSVHTFFSARMAHPMNKFNAAGLMPEHSMNLPVRAASSPDENLIIHALMSMPAMSDEDLSKVFAPEIIYTAPNGQVLVGKIAVSAYLRANMQPDSMNLLETPSLLPPQAMVIDMHMPSGKRHLLVLKRRVQDGLVSTMTDEEGHCKTWASLAARAASSSIHSPTDTMVSPCTSKLSLAKRRHHLKAKPTTLFAGVRDQQAM